MGVGWVNRFLGVWLGVVLDRAWVGCWFEVLL